MQAKEQWKQSWCNVLAMVPHCMAHPDLSPINWPLGIKPHIAPGNMWKSKQLRKCLHMPILTMGSCVQPYKIFYLNPHTHEKRKIGTEPAHPLYGPLITEMPCTATRKRCPGHMGWRHKIQTKVSTETCEARELATQRDWTGNKYALGCLSHYEWLSLFACCTSDPNVGSVPFLSPNTCNPKPNQMCQGLQKHTAHRHTLLYKVKPATRRGCEGTTQPNSCPASCLWTLSTLPPKRCLKMKEFANWNNWFLYILLKTNAIFVDPRNSVLKSCGNMWKHMEMVRTVWMHNCLNDISKMWAFSHPALLFTSHPLGMGDRKHAGPRLAWRKPDAKHKTWHGKRLTNYKITIWDCVQIHSNSNQWMQNICH